MKVKELQEKLAGVNPEAEVGAMIGVEGTELFNAIDLHINSLSDDAGEANSICLIIEKAENVKIIRKALLVQYDIYHPSLNKNYDEEQERYAESIADFLTSCLPCDMEEAKKIANEVMNEVASLSVEEVKARIERKECIGGIINRVVGREIIPAVLPDMK